MTPNILGAPLRVLLEYPYGHFITRRPQSPRKSRGSNPLPVTALANPSERAFFDLHGIYASQGIR